jgi:hypothetical protein
VSDLSIPILFEDASDASASASVDEVLDVTDASDVDLLTRNGIVTIGLPDFEDQATIRKVVAPPPPSTSSLPTPPLPMPSPWPVSSRFQAPHPFPAPSPLPAFPAPSSSSPMLAAGTPMSSLPHASGRHGSIAPVITSVAPPTGSSADDTMKVTRGGKGRRSATGGVVVVRGRPNAAWAIGLLAAGALATFLWTHAAAEVDPGMAAAPKAARLTYAAPTARTPHVDAFTRVASDLSASSAAPAAVAAHLRVARAWRPASPPKAAASAPPPAPPPKAPAPAVAAAPPPRPAQPPPPSPALRKQADDLDALAREQLRQALR